MIVGALAVARWPSKRRAATLGVQSQPEPAAA
jgi:hypothetical protein